MEVKLRSLPESLSEIKTSLPRLHGRNRWNLGLVLAGIAATASLIASCTPAPIPSEILHRNQTATAVAAGIGGQFETPYVNPIRAATAEAEATAAPPPEPSATATETSKTPTPEKKPLFSKLFPGIDISNAEIIPYKEGSDEFELVGITLPPDTDLIAHVDLEVSKNEARAPFSGSDAFLDIPEDAGIGAIVIIGNFKFIREIPATEKIKAGNKYATTTETDGKNLNGKTLIVWISKMDRSTKKFFTPKELVEKYFPGINPKPKAQQIDYQGPIIGQTIYKYFGGPNDK